MIGHGAHSPTVPDVAAGGLLADGLLTLREVCGRLRCSRSFVYSLFEEGALPWVALGRGRRVSEAALRRLIAERTRGGWSL